MTSIIASASADSPHRNVLDTLAHAARDLWFNVIDLLPDVIAGFAVLFVFMGAARGLRWIILRATRGKKRANVGQVFGRLGYFGLLLFGVLVALTVVIPSMTPAKLISLLGIGGVAIGFAFKDIFQNMLAGVLLLWREPFRIGDEITSGQYTGTVEAIETRATFIRKPRREQRSRSVFTPGRRRERGGGQALCSSGASSLGLGSALSSGTSRSMESGRSSRRRA